MKKYDVIFKRTKTSAVQTWQIIVEGNSYYTVDGQIDGVKSKSAPTVCKGKNIGKANETTDEQQAIAEAEAKIEKKLKTGYSEDIANIDTCLKYFEPQLAEKYIEFKDSVVFPILASRKIDGARMVNTATAITTRKGEDYLSCPHIQKALKPFFVKHPKGVVDGEIYSHGQFFEKIMSLVRKKKPTQAEIDESEKLCKLWIFDGIVDDSKEGFAKRFSDLKRELKATIDSKTLEKYFVFVENVVINSHEAFEAEHDKYAGEGFEGAILRYANAPYYNKRSKYLLKYKHFIDEEFVIVDFLEGTGSDAGLASKIVVRLKDGSTSEAGIRGDTAYVTQLLKDRKHYIGKKATIRYQNFTKYGKLHFGVAVNIDRFDI